jgi:type IV pilus assembly protein PilO
LYKGTAQRKTGKEFQAGHKMSEVKSKIKKFTEKSGQFFEKVGSLTKVQRLLICVLTFALIGGLYYYFIFMPKYDELKKVEKQYQSRLNTLATYKKRAAQIIKYEKLMAQTQAKFNTAMKALPDKRELPSLLTGISNAGSNAGLAFHLFKPDNEINKEFYNEIPVSLKVVGRYHQVTDFFYQIIRLNRIVNINNVDLKSKKGSKELEMSCKAVTYMFVEKKVQEPKKGRKKRKK